MQLNNCGNLGKETNNFNWIMRNSRWMFREVLLLCNWVFSASWRCIDFSFIFIQRFKFVFLIKLYIQFNRQNAIYKLWLLQGIDFVYHSIFEAYYYIVWCNLYRSQLIALLITFGKTLRFSFIIYVIRYSFIVPYLLYINYVV